MPGQSRRGSATEAFVNVLVGYCINMLANSLIFPLFGWPISLEQNLLLGVFYTLISLARSYCLRRLFNQATVLAESDADSDLPAEIARLKRALDIAHDLQAESNAEKAGLEMVIGTQSEEIRRLHALQPARAAAHPGAVTASQDQD